MPLNAMELKSLCPSLLKLSREAGAAILEIYESEFDVEQKSDDSPLTAADLASHHTIVKGLTQLTPDWKLLSEESAGISWDERRTWDRYWLIDPLDGTKEFVKRNGEFTVNIALIENGKPVLGVVYVPVSGIAYYGSAGNGAFRVEPDGSQKAIQATKPAQSPLRVVGSRSHMSPRVKAYVDAIGDFDLVSMGSSLKFCLLAEGLADLYPRLAPTSEWDTAAAQAVVEAAGGQVTRTDGTPLRYNTRETLLNPEFLVFADSARDWTSAIPAGLTHEDTLGR